MTNGNHRTAADLPLNAGDVARTGIGRIVAYNLLQFSAQEIEMLKILRLGGRDDMLEIARVRFALKAAYDEQYSLEGPDSE